MNQQLVESNGKEIRKIYYDYCKTSIEKVIQMGKLLEKVKDEVGYGYFGSWVENNLPFSQKTAENYMGVYRLSIREEGIPTDIEPTEAYKLIPHKPKQTPSVPEPEPEPEVTEVDVEPDVEPEVVTEPKVVPKPKEPEVVEEEFEEELDDQEEILEDLKTNFLKLDSNHKNMFVDWLSSL